MKEFLNQIENELINTCEKLNTIDNNTASKIAAPGKWSIKEILGHLIDSAFNNQRRFILMHSQENLIFDGYDQDEWVRLSGYQKRDFLEIVNLWKSLNLHIINVLQNFNSSFWDKEYKRHGLEKSYWKVTPMTEPGMPSLFAKDYFAHMRHHLKQIEELSNLDLYFGNALNK